MFCIWLIVESPENIKTKTFDTEIYESNHVQIIVIKIQKKI